ncbi:hypothetical protein VE04_02566 [Pseudogymnoascus sp. 24MN13]|nr:hypothetical protein VE04_02566 [Pseudogymnoascus sp. 24MN13]
MPESIPTLTTPPGSSTPYKLPCFTGELWTIPTSKSTMRLLATAKETSNAFAVVGTGGTFDNPIGFHYHREAHDVFLCLKGTLNVWANDSARSLGPGDFASVPPNTVHQYQIASAHTEFVGLIIPGGWEEFFRFVGEPFSGPLFPTHDSRSPFEVLIPKLIAATEKFDMVPVREKASFDPQPWDGTESQLPGVCENGGYFLKADTGPKFATGGTIVRPLATRKESDGKFSIYCVEGSKLHDGKGLEKTTFKFEKTHHVIQVIEGLLSVVINGNQTIVGSMETVFIPAESEWRCAVHSVAAKYYVFANGGGIGEVLTGTGSPFEWVVVPEAGDLTGWDEKQLEGLQKELEFVIV